jgi:iron-sulfur cluster repair protein YtfE (RIC family)
MKGFTCLIIVILLLSRCKQKDKYVYLPLQQQSGVPGSLMKQHEYLLSKAKSFSVNNDSIAKELYEVIEYHFSEEEQYLFPVLGILPELAAGNIPEKTDSIVAFAEKFKTNSAKLLAEHQMITKLIGEYRLKSKLNDTALIIFEKELLEHARFEEEIYFPAAVVIGDYLKLKSNNLKQ